MPVEVKIVEGLLRSKFTCL